MMYSNANDKHKVVDKLCVLAFETNKQKYIQH